MQLLSTANLAVKDIAVIVAVVEAVVVVSTDPNIVGADAEVRQTPIVQSMEGTWYPSHRNDP